MKKILSTIAMSSVSDLAAAQDASSPDDMGFNGEVLKISASIFVVILVMIFILAVLKRMLDHRIKNRIVVKGVSEELASFILRPDASDGNANIKWFLILTGIGIGLTLINYTLPLGIHSIAIMSFSIAVSFLGYYQYLKRSRK
jgi:hypothetical protein